jgi:hypothetical protein
LENGDIFYGPLEYFTDIWDMFWPFGTFVLIWYIFPYRVPRKIWQPWLLVAVNSKVVFHVWAPGSQRSSSKLETDLRTGLFVHLSSSY